MKALVVTPTLGRSRYLGETIATVAAVRPKPRHVLVCPPGEVDAVSRRFEEVTVIGSEARGVYPAIDAGVASCDDWEVWTWLNDDDRLRPDAVSSMLVRMDADPSIDVAYGRVRYVGHSGQDLGPLPVEVDPGRLSSVFAAGLPGLTQQGTFVRRRKGGDGLVFDGRYRFAGDFDYWARLLVERSRFVFYDEVVADYRLHRGQVSSDTDAVAREISASALERFGPLPVWRRLVSRTLFRARHVGDLTQRLRVTGCLRTSALYRKAAAGDEP